MQKRDEREIENKREELEEVKQEAEMESIGREMLRRTKRT